MISGGDGLLGTSMRRAEDVSNVAGMSFGKIILSPDVISAFVARGVEKCIVS